MKKILSFYPRYDAMSEKTSHATVPLKVSTNEKRDGLNLVSIERSCFKLFTLKFSKQICAGPHPVRELKPLGEGCSYYLNTIIVVK